MSNKQVDGDLHYKLCKKIAQLTKVIYHLNLQNEDNDTRFSDIRERHDNEIRQLHDATNKRVEEVKESFRAAEQDRIGIVENAQRQYKESLEAAKAEYLRKISAMTEDLKASKARFETAVKDVVASCKADAEKAIAEKCQSKDAETANLVREYNDRYKAMLAEQMNAKDELEKTINDLRSKLEGAERAHAQELKQLEAKQKDSDAKAAAELARWKEECEKARECVQKLQAKCDSLSNCLNEKASSLGSYRETEAKLREIVKALENRLSDSQKQCETLNDTLAEKLQELAKKDSIVINLENQRSLLETRNSELTTKNLELQNQISVLEKRLETLSTQLHDIEKLNQDEANQHSQFEAQLRGKCADLQRCIEELEKRHLEDLDQLRKSHAKSMADYQSSATRAAEEASDEFRRAKEEVARLHQAEKDKMKKEHEKQVAELKRDHDRQINSVRESLSTASRAEAEMQELEKKLRDTIASLEAELKVAWERLEETDKCLKEVTQNLEEETLRYAQRLQELEADAEQRVRAVCADRDGKISALEAQLAEIRQEAESRLKEVAREWEQKLEEGRNANNRGLVAELEACHNAYAQQLKLLSTLHEEQLHHFSQKEVMCLEQVTSHCNSVIKDIADRAKNDTDEKEAVHRALKESGDRLRQREEDLRRLKEQLDGIRGDANKQRSVMLEETQALKGLIAKLIAEKEGLEASDRNMSNELQELRRNFATSQRDALDAQRQVQDLEATIATLREDAKRAIQDAETRLQESLKAVMDSCEQKAKAELDNLRASAAMERDNLQRRADESLSALRLKYNNTQEELRDAMLRIDGLTNELGRCSEELKMERQRLAAAKSEFDEILRRKQHDHDEKMQHLEQQAENILNELGMKHKMFVDDLIQQQQEERTGHNARLRELQRAFDDLRHRYEYRESRQEDVEMINRLMKEAKKKEQDLKKALEDMKMYKLELVNREDNYNKVFGRRPVVAPREAASKFQSR